MISFPQNANQRAEEQPQFDGVKQLPGESTMWFNRFQLYRDMGFKRSLRGAVALERSRLRSVSSPNKATHSHDESAKKQEQVKYKGVLTSVDFFPKQVPGSWKDAAVKFRWQERCKAYETMLLADLSKHQLAQLSHTYANKFKRIHALNEMIETTRHNVKISAIEVPAMGLLKGHQIVLGYTKELRSLLAELRTEMKDTDEQALLTWMQLYNESWPDLLERSKACQELSENVSF